VTRERSEDAARASGAADEIGELAVVLGGGGARGAYQAGVLRYVGRRFPDLRISILTGVSVGSINTVYLANHPGNVYDQTAALADLWSSLSVERVFRVDARSLLSQGVRALGQVMLWGGLTGAPPFRGLVDSAPLEQMLQHELNSRDGSLPGIAANLERGPLRAVALTATHYATGATITWCQGRGIREWDRPQRRSVTSQIRVEHVMASAAIPLFFPAVRIGESWYGDGGVRLHAPLSPAAHLGASKILAVSTRHPPDASDTCSLEASRAYPQPAQILGLMYNAVFLDLLDQDAMHMQRINDLLHSGKDASLLRPLELLVMRPSQDLGAVARDYEPCLPGLFRFLSRRLGTRQSSSTDLISMFMFQADYLARLIALGEADAAAREADLVRLLEPFQARTRATG
jgi:NTE family protein